MANDSIGALWQKSGKKGTWFSGSIEVEGKKIPLVVFKNDYKKEDKHPDYKIFISDPQQKGQSPNSRSSNPPPQEATETPPDDDGLPF